MRKETLHVALACFAGATIGALVALEIHPWFWWVGLLVGATIGYIAYNPKEVGSGIARAYREARGWRPDWAWWKLAGRVLGGLYVVLASMVIWFMAVLAALFMSFVPDLRPHDADTALTAVLDGGIAAGFISAILFVTCLYATCFAGLKETNDDIVNPGLKYFNPVALPVTVVRWVLKTGLLLFACLVWILVIGTVVGVPRVLAFLKHFIMLVFRYIHSDIRVLCAIDAAIGAAVGFYVGSAIIGGFAGLIVGVLNYEIFSVRVFKLVPRRP